MDHHALLDPTLTVPSVPDAPSGVAWLRANVARFAEHDAHARRRALVDAELAAIDPESLRRSGNPVATLAEALGLPRTVTRDVAVVADSYQPHTEITPAADAAVARLVSATGGRWDEPTANRIGLLVQAQAATDALIAGRNPPVPVTRRVTPSGKLVEIDLTNAPFGAGHHACPGRTHALALADGVTRFHRAHHGPAPLLLPNAWDFASAAALVDAGFTAIGTTSLGVTAAHGIPDAAGLGRTETIALARRLVRLPVPITVDIEAGYGCDLFELAAELSEMGVAGVNIEDGHGTALADPAVVVSRIRALKAGGPHLFVNARVDTYWLAKEKPSTLERALAYLDAGADGIFVPGLVAEREIASLVATVPAPLNVLAQLDVRILAALGVRRVSTGSLLFRAGLKAAVAAARAVAAGEPVSDVPSYAEVSRLL